MDKIILVGCGAMSSVWMDYVKDKDNCEIVGCVDVMLESANKMIDKYQLKCKAFDDLAAAIKETGANLVFDVTPPSVHHQNAKIAMELNCDVMIEKPMATSLEEASEMIEVSDRTGRSLAIMQNYRYKAGVRKFHHLLQTETVGNIGFIGADFFMGPHFGGFRDIMDNPLLLDMAIHTFDQARLLSGANAVAVYCHEFNPQGSWYAGNASAVCIFEMSDGSVFNYRGSWCSEGSATSWDSTWRIIGDKGTAIWDGLELMYIDKVLEGPEQDGKWMRDTERIETDYVWEGQEGHHGCLDEMFLARLEGRRAETDCRDNIESLKMVIGAIQSAKEGRRIVI